MKQQLPPMKAKVTEVARQRGSEAKTVACANIQENYVNVELSLQG